MAISWCKVASNLDSHPKIRRAGRNGREVFLFALRRNAEPGNKTPGRLSGDELAPWYLADQLQMPECDAVTGVTAAVTAGLLVQDGYSFVIVGWEDGWGKDNGSGAERTQRWRENKRLQPVVTGVTSPNVTVTSSDGGDTEEKRREETRREREDSDTPAAVGSRHRRAKPSEPTPEERAVADRVLAKLSERNGVRYSGNAEHLRLITAQLRAGVPEMDLRYVVGYCADELGWEDDPDKAKYLRPETLFGPKTIARYLDPARTWVAKHKLAPSQGATP